MTIYRLCNIDSFGLYLHYIYVFLSIVIWIVILYCSSAFYGMNNTYMTNEWRHPDTESFLRNMSAVFLAFQIQTVSVNGVTP